MLQQILNDMYVDPELLVELDEEQKQILFCKMREEQIRKWRCREEQEQENEIVVHRKEGGKKVSFLMGGDGEPLVLVLGENEDVDALLQERARRQAEMEGESIRKAAEEELDKLVRLSQSTVQAMEQSSLNRSQKSQKNNACDPTRDAVVQSLQEATREMEKEILALELQERIFEKPLEPILEKSLCVNNSLSKGKLQNNLVTTELSALPLQVRPGMGPEKENSQPNIKVTSLKPNITVQPYFNENVSPNIFGVAAQIEQYERLTESSIEALKNATLERAKKRRQKEIFDNLRNQVEAAKKQVEANVTAAVTAEKEEVVWREQEKKAKEAERRIREIARRARVEHLRTASISFTDCQMLPEKDEDINGNFNPDSDLSNNNHNISHEAPIQRENFPANTVERTNVVRPKLRPIRPSSKHAIIEWFQEEELPKGVGLNSQRTQIHPWFHGIISRIDAEKLLEKAQVGSYLIRVSERIWGYAASYRAPDRCRHYLIDAVEGKYAFLGSNQATHQTLDQLIEFHTKEYITMSGCELLNSPCGQEDPRKPDFRELLFGTKYFPLAYSKT